MKKLVFPLLAALAMVFTVSSCGSPVDKFLNKLEPMLEMAEELDDIDDMSKKQKKDMISTIEDLIDILDENEDYELTDSDKEAVIDFSVKAYKKMAKKEGEKVDDDDIKEMKKEAKKDLKKIDTLGDLAQKFGFDEKSLKRMLKELKGDDEDDD